MDNTIQQSSPSELPKWGPFVALGSTLRRNIQFRGRASRAEFWYTMLGHGITSLILQALIAIGVYLIIYGDYNVTTCIVLTSIVGLFFLFYQAFIAIPLLALCVRRMHDIGRSGASLFFYFIPLAGPIILLIFLLTESSGANQYGEAPAAVADSAECGKFINSIISIVTRCHSSLKNTAITWSSIIFGGWFLLWLVTPGYVTDLRGKDFRAAYKCYRRGETYLHAGFIDCAIKENRYHMTAEHLVDELLKLVDEGINEHILIQSIFNSGDSALAAVLLKKGVIRDINAEINDYNGMTFYSTITLLSLAVKDSNIELVKSLLATPGIDVNAGRSTPLHTAAFHNNTEAIKLLLAAPNIDVNKANANGSTPLGIVIYKHNIEAIKLLLAAPNIDVNKDTPLVTAILYKNIEAIKLLLSAPNIDVNKTSDNGNTPLYTAISDDNIEAINLLLSAPNIDVNKANGNGNTPLHEAAAKAYEYGELFGRLRILQLLLSSPNIEVNKRNKQGETPDRYGFRHSKYSNRARSMVSEVMRKAGATRR